MSFVPASDAAGTTAASSKSVKRRAVDDASDVPYLLAVGHRTDVPGNRDHLPQDTSLCSSSSAGPRIEAGSSPQEAVEAA